MSRSGNGDSGPDGGLPDLPPDWGPIVIPDDASELAAEAAAVRRELGRRARADRAIRWRRRPLPLILLLIALLATLASLVAVIRTSPSRQPGGTSSPPATGDDGGGPGPGRTLPALDLVGERGELVPLRGLLPAMIVIVDGCACDGQLDAALVAAPPEVTVVAVASGPAPPPSPAVGGDRLRRLADPTGELRHVLQLPTPTGRPTTVLVGRSAAIVRTVPDYTSPEQILTELPQLVDR